MNITISIEVEMKDLLEKCRVGNGTTNPKCVLKINGENTVETEEVKFELTENDEINVGKEVKESTNET